MLSNFSNKKALLVLFLEGFVSVSLQIFIMRQLVPFVGNSVVVMSFVVGIFLAALSVGYWAGGKHEDNHLKYLIRNLMLSAFLITFTFSYYFMDFTFNILNSFVETPLIQVGIYLSLFLFPVVFLLGQTIPILTNFIKNKAVSEITGNALAINTVGSVLGSVVTSLILFYFFGMAATLAINVVLLILISLLIVDDKKSISLILGKGSLIVFMAFIINIDFERNKFVDTTNYANYEVVNSSENGIKSEFLIINDSYSSGMYNREFAFRYIEHFLYLIDSLEIKQEKFLVLGAGGFTLSYFDKNDNEFTYVDIDPQIKEIAEKEFLKQNIKGNFIAEDARTYIRKSNTLYDNVVVDLFTNRTSIPWHVTTKEFFIDVKNSTKENGYVFINVIASKDFDDDYSRMIHNTIHSVFGYCHSTSIMFPNSETANLEYMCKNIAFKEKSVFIDDRSITDIKSF